MRRIGPTSTDVARLLPLILAAACGPGAPADPSPATVADQVEDMLLDSADSWNDGDLDGFLDDYAPDATFVGATGLIRGVDQIRQRYAQGYWSTGAPPDLLSFEVLDVRTIRPDVAVAVGRYVLQERDTRRETATGLFSLTLERRNGEWKIVHDHSSATDPG